MRIGLRREMHEGERRVALVPEVVALLVGDGHEVVVEAGAGLGAGHRDAEYVDAGATIADTAGVRGAELIATVHGPRDAELAALGEGVAVVGFLDPLGDIAGVGALATSGVSSLAVELVPRTTRAQTMDALSSQATVAGYKAVLLAANALPRMFPLLMTAAGTVKPARVLVIGAGVAGLQAIATARRLGAVVTGYDTRPAVEEQVASLGARFLRIDVGESGEGEGGYARELSAEAQARQRQQLADAIGDYDVVITTAAVPGRRAPVLIPAAAVEAMRPGSVIVDLAAETGGNCALTQPGRMIVHEGVAIIGSTGVASLVPGHASALYSRNLLALIRHLVVDGALDLTRDDDIVRGVLVTRAGQIVHPVVLARAAELAATAAGGVPDAP